MNRNTLPWHTQESVGERIQMIDRSDGPRKNEPMDLSCQKMPGRETAFLVMLHTSKVPVTG